MAMGLVARRHTLRPAWHRRKSRSGNNFRITKNLRGLFQHRCNRFLAQGASRSCQDLESMFFFCFSGRALVASYRSQKFSKSRPLHCGEWATSSAEVFTARGLRVFRHSPYFHPHVKTILPYSACSELPSIAKKVHADRRERAPGSRRRIRQTKSCSMLRFNRPTGEQFGRRASVLPVSDFQCGRHLTACSPAHHQQALNLLKEVKANTSKRPNALTSTPAFGK